jgi:hypothetical protein
MGDQDLTQFPNAMTDQIALDEKHVLGNAFLCGKFDEGSD